MGARKGTAWSPQDEFILRKLYANTSNAEIGEIVGRAPRYVGMKARKLGLSKSAKYMATAGRFQPGQEPSNKGRPAAEWNPNLASCRATQFKKGRPATEARNYRPIGSERVTKDGALERKVTDDPSVRPALRWVAVTRLVWEAANGPIPRGHAVVFKPGRATTDPERITPDSVELVTRAELMDRNSYWKNCPPEVARLYQLRGALNRKINNRSKQP